MLFNNMWAVARRRIHCLHIGNRNVAMKPTDLMLEAPAPQPLRELSALRDLVRLSNYWHRRLSREPRGNARVMVIPGFLTGDGVTWPLRRTLQSLGHRVEGWGLGLNYGAVDQLLPKLVARVRAISHGEPLHLVGWSLGGYLAREVARELPERVVQVITLASPIVGGPKYTVVAKYYRDRRGVDLDAIERQVAARDAVPIRVPVTAVYSRNDTIVCPAACIDRVNRMVRHVEVACSHTGFAVAPEVHAIVARQITTPGVGQ